LITRNKGKIKPKKYQRTKQIPKIQISRMKNKEEGIKRLNKKHFLMINNSGLISATTPKNWARANQDKFPKYSFTDSENTPRTKEIERYLEETLMFKRVENDEIVILYPYKEL
tara:strand:+ start:81 stop:419 length:339 start_codon:yes stop_codon:yes gene_type:complete